MRAAILALLFPVTAWAGWDGYQVVMWQDQTPARLSGLRALGVSGLRVSASRDDLSQAAILAPATTARTAGVPYYVENIATDFYSAYHRWRPDQPVNAAYLAAQAAHAADPGSLVPFIRAPSLSDPAWLARVTTRIAAHVAAHAASRPLFYNLADEPGIADLAAAWDFDFSPESLAGFRDWLHGQYTDLAALNAEWGMSFASWDAVMPETTLTALSRTDGNFAAWSDFKAWMDEAFARALRAGTDAAHATDPTALAGIEGGQIPGWGGWDYARLPHAVDVMEIYESGENTEIVRSLVPSVVRLTTISNFASTSDLWQAALAGGRGVILWDEQGALVDEAGRPSARGAAMGAVWRELHGALGASLASARPHVDPVAIVYSQASFRAEWISTRVGTGHAWSAGTAESSATDPSAVRTATQLMSRAMLHAGLQPRWLAAGDLTNAGLQGMRMLLLPETLAMSDAEIAAIEDFVAGGGVVLSSGRPALFDEHARRRAAAPDLRALPFTPSLLPPSAISVRTPSGQPASDVEIRQLDGPEGRIVTLQRDGPSSADAPYVLTTNPPALARSLRDIGPSGVADHLALRLSAAEPVVLLLEQPGDMPPGCVRKVTGGCSTR